MPGPRLPTDVVKERGRKHLSKAEEAERRQSEVKLPKPKKISPPKWLPGYLKEEFKALAKELLEADMGAAGLDRDTIGRYLVASRQYTAAAIQVQDALDAENSEKAAEWMNIQDKCFKQANKCANDMGMTLTSRCKLVVPTKKEDPGEDEFTAFLQRRRASGGGQM